MTILLKTTRTTDAQGAARKLSGCEPAAGHAAGPEVPAGRSGGLRRKTVLLAMLCQALSLPTAFAGDPAYLPVQTGGKWGYIDATGHGSAAYLRSG